MWSAFPSIMTGCEWTPFPNALADLKRRGVTPKYIYTIPTVQNPTGTILPEGRRAELLRLSEQYGVPIFEDDCYADLIWDGKRPPALYAMSRTAASSTSAHFQSRSRRRCGSASSSRHGPSCRECWR